MSVASKLSYRDQVPPDLGGQHNRQGIEFQDHVAAHFCLLMLSDTGPIEVWCETLDDITVVWPDVAGGEIFEFIQAKHLHLDQFWSIAKLCESKVVGSKKKIPHSSIVERLLSRDSCSEPCRYRVATSVDFNSDLELMTLPLSSPARQSAPAIDAIVSKLKKKIKDYASPNGNNVEHWVRNGTCHNFGKPEHLVTNNNMLLSAFASETGLALAPPQIAKLYERFVRRVFNAGKASWRIDPADKKILRSELKTWLSSEAVEMGLPESKGENLRRKMEHAHLDATLIEGAQTLRRRYRQSSINAGYLETSSRTHIEAEAIAVLHERLLHLLANSHAKDGHPFLVDCQQALRDLWLQSASRQSWGVSYLYGYMYEVSDRCLHRFSRNFP